MNLHQMPGVGFRIGLCTFVCNALRTLQGYWVGIISEGSDSLLQAVQLFFSQLELPENLSCVPPAPTPAPPRVPTAWKRPVWLLFCWASDNPWGQRKNAKHWCWHHPCIVTPATLLQARWFPFFALNQNERGSPWVTSPGGSLIDHLGFRMMVEE